MPSLPKYLYWTLLTVALTSLKAKFQNAVELLVENIERQYVCGQEKADTCFRGYQSLNDRKSTQNTTGACWVT